MVQAAVSGSDTSEGIKSDKLPSYFPLTVPKCKEVSEVFFKCFSTSAQSLDDQELPVKGSVEKCSQELESYRKCMTENYQNPKKRKKWFGIF